MTDAFIRVLDKLIDLAKELIWTTTACITSGVLLVFYQYHMNAFGIYDFLTSNKTILAFILIVFITSLSFIVCTLLWKAINLLSKKYAKRQLMQPSYDRIQRYLTEQQKDMLQKMVDAPDNSSYIPYYEHITMRYPINWTGG